jgi:hypothetical protein
MPRREGDSQLELQLQDSFNAVLASQSHSQLNLTHGAREELRVQWAHKPWRFGPSPPCWEPSRCGINRDLNPFTPTAHEVREPTRSPRW